jgi:hypothetical protein
MSFSAVAMLLGILVTFGAASEVTAQSPDSAAIRAASASIALHCAAARRSRRSGSCTASCTTSRSSRTTDTPPDAAHHTDLLRPGRPVNANLTRNALSAATRF